MFIDVNPRLVEPGNAAASGVDLIGPLLDIARGRHPGLGPTGASGVRTRQGLLAVLGAAQHRGTRRAVAGTLVALLARRGPFAGTSEELTPVAGDLRAMVPLVAATGAILVHPPLWRSFSGGAVASYSLSAAGWDAVLADAGAGDR